MHVFKDLSIKQKLIRISLLTAGFALILSAAALTINEVIVFKKSLLNELTTQTEIIGSNCTAALTFNDAKTAKEILSALKANRDIDVALIYAKDGALFAEYSRSGKNPDAPHGPQKEGYRFGLNEVEIYRDIVLDHDGIGSIYIHANLNALYANLFRQTGVFLAAMLLSLFAVYLLSSGLQKTITGIISELVRTMKTISGEKDYSVRAAVRSKDELGALAEGLNEMLVQIQTRDAELEAYRKNLEELVDNRTGQLQAANEQLKGELADRKRAEDALRESEAFIKTIMDNLPIGIAVNSVDPKVTFTYMNDNFAKSYRTTRDALGVPDGFWNAVYEDPEFREKIKMKVLEDCASGNPEQMHWIDVPLTRKGKETTYIEAMNTPLPGRGWMISTVWDVTERKRAEEKLEKSEKFVEDILSSVDEAFVVVDREYRILMANRAYCEQTGKPLGNIVGRHCYAISHHAAKPCNEPEHVCGCKRTFETGEPTFTVHTHTDDNGKQSQVEIRTYAMKDASGEIQSVIEVINDITEKAALENQLRHAQKMESIGTLAGGIAHDFNNILSAVIGYGHLTLMKMPQNDPLRLNIEHMLESADRAAALTQSLLAFSRKQIIDRKSVDLNAILRRVEKFLVRVIGEDVEVRMTLDTTTLTIFADAGQLEQMLMNLATNARDAMPNGGSFTIETATTELDSGFVAAHGYGKPGTYAMIAVSDTGMGMNEATRKKIFEPFFTTKEVGKGTGLGLAMVYGIIKQHEGFINAYSEPGKGTTFRIYLPLTKDAAAEEKITVDTAYPKGGTETILFAEDDANLRKLSVYVLEQMGYTVITANDGEEAVAQFREHQGRIQLLLFDMIMPKKGGKEAFDEIRRLDPAVPVLFASGYSPDMLRQKALVEDGAVVVFKPISPQALLRKVREVLDRTGTGS